MTLARIQCVVLELHDRLFLERDYVRSGFSAVAAHLEVLWGITGFFEVAWGRFEAGHRGRIFDETLSDLDRDDAAGSVDQLVAVYRSHVPDISLLPDAQRLLNQTSCAWRAVITTALLSANGPRRPP